MKKIIVLGAGLVGKVMAVDLSKDYAVTVADINRKALDEIEQSSQFTVHSSQQDKGASAVAVNRELSTVNQIKTIDCDISNKAELQKAIAPFDLVVGAVPGFMGFEMLKNVIEAKKNIVDISFFPEDALELDELAKKNGVTAIVDCGVAPGMCNVLFGHHNTKMKVTRYECLVGGLPQVREWPFEYKAVFSPIDVIEEYTRPARYVENGAMVTKEALTDLEKIEFEEVGTLESFNTDGLRSLALTMPHVPNMIEKTLRYPGHVELMKVFRETGFFSKEKISIGGHEISPLELTTKLLFPKWKMKEGDEDVTVMRVTIEGEENHEKKTYVYHLHDKFDRKTKTTSMARTTGYTCTAAAHLILEEKYDRKGISPPEYIGENEECMRFMLHYLEQRNVVYKKISL